MLSENEMRREVREYYDRHANGVVPVSRVVHDVLKAHPIKGGEAEWYESIATVGLWYIATQLNRDIKAAENEPGVDQGELFPGYKRLQRRYSVIRGGEQCLVAVELLTDGEIDAKVAEHRVMAAGHELHARELERFKQERGTH